MAPELRKKKSRESAKSTSGRDRQRKAAKSKIASAKRKATDDTSPVTRKKTKIVDSDPPRSSKTLEDVPEPEDTTKETEEPSAFDSEDEERGAAASKEMMKFIDSDGEDSDADPGDVDAGPIQKIPKVPKHQKPAGGTEKEDPGVVYIGRIPHGFYEKEMRAFFSQFGDINKLRLSRNKKTGASKHYAFIEFAEESTAEIVARTMDNYYMFNHILKVKMVPKSQIHPDLWKGCDKRFKAIPRRKIEARALLTPKSEAQWNKLIIKENQRRNKRAKKLKAIGYDFEAPRLAAISGPAAIAAPEDGTEDGEQDARAIELAAEKECHEAGKKEQEAKPEDDEQEHTAAVGDDAEAPVVATKGSTVEQESKA